MEILDIVDEKGNPTGETVDRKIAHEKGILHRTSHVWILRKKQKKVQILLQKRSDNKDSYPGCYDISSAGHIPAGQEFVSSALRELNEELGCEAKAEELILCGQRRFWFEKEFHGKPFYDNQVSNVYIMWLDKAESEFKLQKEEVSNIKWFDFDMCVEAVKNHTISHCIFLEELEMIEGKVKERYVDGMND